MASNTTQVTPFALTGYFGATIPLVIPCTRANGAVVDLTGATFWATFKYQLADLDVASIIQKTNIAGATGVTISAPASAGIAKTQLNPTDIVASPSSNLAMVVYCDVKLKEANGDEWIVGEGTITLSQPATRSI